MLLKPRKSPGMFLSRGFPRKSRKKVPEEVSQKKFGNSGRLAEKVFLGLGDIFFYRLVSDEFIPEDFFPNNPYLIRYTERILEGNSL